MKTRGRSIHAALLCGILLPLLVGGAAFADEPDDESAEEKRKKEEALEKKKAEEELIKEQFDYSFDDVAGNLVAVSCKSSFGRSAGSGFIAQMDGKTYLFTNQHVIMGADRITFKAADGTTLKPRSVELSASRDIARLLLEEDRDDAFPTAGHISMGVPIGVFGNSEGAGVATELYGEVTGIGADLLEVTADFVSGNSGSPVLNLDREVLGIASYVRFTTPSKMKLGTRFENQTRRFCYRLGNSEWMKVNWKKYNGEYGSAHLANEQLLSSLGAVFDHWGDSLKSVLVVDSDSSKMVCSWTKAHNNILRNNQSGSKRFKEEYSRSAKRLGSLCKTEAKTIRELSRERNLTDFLRNEFEQQADALEYYNDLCIYVGDLIYR